ncbi:MAG: hypothetical protein AB1847_10245 [bacterium]
MGKAASRRARGLDTPVLDVGLLRTWTSFLPRPFGERASGEGGLKNQMLDAGYGDAGSWIPAADGMLEAGLDIRPLINRLL